MNPAALVGGAVVLGVTVVDLLWTTLWISGGAGPLTSRLMNWTWRLLRYVGEQNGTLLSLAGPLIFSAGLAMWTVLLWGGWTLVFAGGGDVLVDSLGRGPVSLSDLVYFTGYTVFTLGLGDFVPREGVWQVLSVLASASGFLFVTLIVTYVLSVLGAVVQKRSFATDVTGLGDSGEAIVRTSWDGERFAGIELPLNSLTSELNTLTTNHKAYPVLHYFYSQQPERGAAVAVPVLDEALTLLAFGVPEDDRPDDVVLHAARSSVEEYLRTVRDTFVQPEERDPPSPALDEVAAAGVPTVSGGSFDSALEDLRERRRTLLGLVESSTREWPTAEGD